MAEKVDFEKLQKLATRFRAAIDHCIEWDLFPEDEADFDPLCCGDVVPLLGAYLIDNGVRLFERVEGDRGRFSHAWLQRHDIIIDITRDRFPEKTDKVLVARESPWHQTFGLPDWRGEADFRRYDGYARQRLEPVYRMIVSAIP